MVDVRAPWRKLTNISAAIMAAAEVAALIWPQHAAICKAVAAVALPLLGVGIAKRVALFGEAANGETEPTDLPADTDE